MLYHGEEGPINQDETENLVKDRIAASLPLQQRCQLRLECKPQGAIYFMVHLKLEVKFYQPFQHGRKEKFHIL